MTIEVKRPEVVEGDCLEPKFVDTHQKHRKIVDGNPVELEAVIVEGSFKQYSFNKNLA